MIECQPQRHEVRGMDGHISMPPNSNVSRNVSIAGLIFHDYLIKQPADHS